MEAFCCILKTLQIPTYALCFMGYLFFRSIRILVAGIRFSNERQSL